MDISNKEKNIIEFWKKNKIFEKSLKQTEKSKNYIFYDGPPFATGLPHYGHILASVLKDTFPRFWTMKGRHVRRVWGWDCHGLPIENIAEKELQIKEKNEIEKIGIEKFNSFCKGKVLQYTNEWKKTVERIARWTEFENSYKTMDNDYIESVWWAFKEIYKKGLIYDREKILLYCPRCETPLSKSEIAMDNSYKTIKENTVTVKFKDELKENVYFLAWTTTPWTLSSNLALALHPDTIYVYVKDKESKEIYVLAKDALNRYYKDRREYEILKKVKGKKLLGKTYEPLFPYFEDLENSFKIIPGDFVTTEEGTGIVHTAPAFGEEDYEVCKAHGIDFIQPVTESGEFTNKIKDFAGMNIFDANSKIIEFLKKKGKIVKIEKKEHEYPFCYRCDSPLMYKAIPSLFLNIQKVKKKILSLNKKINWYPEFLKEGRFKKSVEMAPDWNISRNRYWASAIPIWKCKCGEKKIIGSIKELKKYAIKLPKGKIDLHKHYLDKIKLKCTCGKDMERVPEVLDCWFESGSMPFAQFHYPFDNKSLFKKNFPADFVAEYIGQVRTWYYYMTVISAILFNESPFQNVLTTGTILAEDGNKMSKSKKNFPDPWNIFEKYGVDSLRFYLMSSPIMNAENFNFSEKGVEEIYKKVILILYNTQKFYMLNEDNEKSKDKSKEITDEWIVSRLNQTGLKVTEFLEEYNTIKACKEIRDFIEDLSTWYVRINRNRISNEKSARETLRYILEYFSKLIAPIMPFAAEEIYQSLNGNQSIHLEKWPKFDKKKINKKLLKEMEKVREIISLGLKQRDKSQIGLKWPLTGVHIKADFKLDKKVEKLVKNQLNVKNIYFDKPDKKNKGEISVTLDTKTTPELEAEGYAREVSRKIQAFRKKLGLHKNQKVETYLIVEDKLKKILNKNNKFIQERTNSKTLNIATTNKKTFKNKTDLKVKDKKGKIAIIVTNR